LAVAISSTLSRSGIGGTPTGADGSRFGGPFTVPSRIRRAVGFGLRPAFATIHLGPIVRKLTKPHVACRSKGPTFQAKLLKNPGDFDAAHARLPVRGLYKTVKSFNNPTLPLWLLHFATSAAAYRWPPSSLHASSGTKRTDSEGC
jgi:hypothetical protein